MIRHTSTYTCTHTHQRLLEYNSCSPLPPENTSSTHFPSCLAVSCGHLTKSNQWNMSRRDMHFQAGLWKLPIRAAWSSFLFPACWDIGSYMSKMTELSSVWPLHDCLEESHPKTCSLVQDCYEITKYTSTVYVWGPFVTLANKTALQLASFN